ncbi:MAG: efflux RND transporter periplasmic adaptor subunit [Planctomycetota bacterium]
MPELRILLSPLLLALALTACSGDSAAGKKTATRPPAPVAVGSVEQGPITLRRVFSGTLEAAAEVQIAARVSGPVERIAVDLGDAVKSGEVIAWIDDDELVQASLQAEADLAVAEATLREAQAGAEHAARTLQRRETLGAQGVTSQSELDSVRAETLAAQANQTVAEARVQRAHAAVETARLRLQQARVVAEWNDEGQSQAPVRVVSARHVDEGTTVTAGTPLITVLALHPITAVVTVPERDYANLKVGMPASLTTDAWPGEVFAGKVRRIAPSFNRSTRQARAEIEVDNIDLRLKPGMFVRANLELARKESARTVPFAALTQRDGKPGVFQVQDGTAHWKPLEIGIREGDAVEVSGLTTREPVVTLGQELCDDGAPVQVVQESAE